MKNLVKIISILVVASLIWSCRDRRHTLKPYGWSSIDAEFDSLTLVAERYLFLPNFYDSLAATVDRMKARADNLTGDEAQKAKARVGYWESYRRIINTELYDWKKALKYAEFIKDDYTAHRINTLFCWFTNLEEDSVFNSMLSELDYYRSIGDVAMQGFTTLFISNAFGNTGVPELSLKYLQMSDSLLALADLEEQRQNLLINEASLLCETGDLEKGGALLDELMKNPELNEDLFIREMLFRNHYAFYMDSVSLFNGYEMVKYLCPVDSEADGFAAMRGWYEGYILDYYNKAGRKDSADYYMKLAAKHIDEQYDFKSKELIAKIIGDYCKENDMPKEAMDMMNYMVDVQKVLKENGSTANKAYLERVNTLKDCEIRAEASKSNLRHRYFIVITALVILVIVLVSLVVNWRRKQKLRYLEARLDGERKERQILAMSLTQEETNKVLEYVKDETSRLSGESNVKGSDITKIVNNVKLHLADKNDLESFEKTFANVHPGFIKRLREVAPDLSENNVRLCSYLLMGMSNVEIAGIMNVKPSSLRQSRLRLRQKFGLTKDDSLVEFLQDIAKG